MLYLTDYSFAKALARLLESSSSQTVTNSAGVDNEVPALLDHAVVVDTRAEGPVGRVKNTKESVLTKRQNGSTADPVCWMACFQLP